MPVAEVRPRDRAEQRGRCGIAETALAAVRPGSTSTWNPVCCGRHPRAAANIRRGLDQLGGELVGAAAQRQRRRAEPRCSCSPAQWWLSSHPGVAGRGERDPPAAARAASKSRPGSSAIGGRAPAPELVLAVPLDQQRAGPGDGEAAARRRARSPSASLSAKPLWTLANRSCSGVRVRSIEGAAPWAPGSSPRSRCGPNAAERPARSRARRIAPAAVRYSPSQAGAGQAEQRRERAAGRRRPQVSVGGCAGVVLPGRTVRRSRRRQVRRHQPGRGSAAASVVPRRRCRPAWATCPARCAAISLAAAWKRANWRRKIREAACLVAPPRSGLGCAATKSREQQRERARVARGRKYRSCTACSLGRCSVAHLRQLGRSRPGRAAAAARTAAPAAAS